MVISDNVQAAKSNGADKLHSIETGQLTLHVDIEMDNRRPFTRETSKVS